MFFFFLSSFFYSEGKDVLGGKFGGDSNEIFDFVCMYFLFCLNGTSRRSCEEPSLRVLGKCRFSCLREIFCLHVSAGGYVGYCGIY